MTRRLTLALPSKGRLREPSWTLLEASGVSPQEPGERVLQSHCRNADIDLLFVRADDVPEYVQDGVVDCGITGLDLISERECDVEVLLRLGFGSCSLQAAVSIEDTATSVDELAGRRVATSHPNIAARMLADRGRLSKSRDRLRFHHASDWPTRSLTWCRRAVPCARTDFDRSVRCSNPKPS
jgi:ATP phosphoribosyltransferase